MFENLQDRFERAFKVLKGQGQITEINVAETLKEVRRALLEADVSFNIAKAFTNRVKEKALGENVLNSISPSQLLVKITQEELTELMGNQKADINVSGNPGIVLMSGLQGSQKTTFSGKLANYLKTKKNKKPLLVACDVYRPAAIDQLHVVGDGIGVEVFSNKDEKSPLQIAKMGVKHAKENGYDVVILTNQAGITKGIMDPVDVDIVNNYMLELLWNIGCKSINGLYYSTSNLKEDVYAKPNTGMFKRASAEIGVDWKNGVYVGDKISDLKAAIKAKAKPILVRTGHGAETAKKLNTFANKDLKKQTETFDNLNQFAHSLVDLT